MKKLICILLIACLAFALNVNVLAAEFANMYTLLQEWETNGYPDDVGSIYSTDGSPYNFTVQLVGDDIEARADEIRAMLDDPSTVTFEKGTYTDKQLHEISSEIANTYMTDGSGVQSVGVGWGSNGGFGASGKEMRVVVVADEDRAIDLYQELGSKYGEAVIVEASKGELKPTEEPSAEQEAADEQLITPGPAENAAKSEAKENKIPEKTESTILEITFIAMGAIAAFLIILSRRRKKMK